MERGTNNDADLDITYGCFAPGWAFAFHLFSMPCLLLALLVCLPTKKPHSPSIALPLSCWEIENKPNKIKCAMLFLLPKIGITIYLKSHAMIQWINTYKIPRVILWHLLLTTSREKFPDEMQGKIELESQSRC